MIRLGAPIYTDTDDPQELARLHRQAGYRAAYCPPLDPHDEGRIRAVREAFADHDVVIAEVGAWCNVIGPDEQKRQENIDYVCTRLDLADRVGARCCVDYPGTLAPGEDWGPHPDNLGPRGLERVVETVRRIIDTVRPRRARFALEMMQWVVPDSVDSYAELLRAVDRDAFAVHLDPVNIITSPRLYWRSGELIRECFRRLGEHIVSCHAKDIVGRPDLALHLDETRPGLGVLDYRAYLTELNRLPEPPPLMLEHLSGPQEYDEARDHLFALGRELDVSFGD